MNRVFLTPEPTDCKGNHKHPVPTEDLGPLGLAGPRSLVTPACPEDFPELQIIQERCFSFQSRLAWENKEPEAHPRRCLSAPHWSGQASRAGQAFLPDAPRLGLPPLSLWLPSPPTQTTSLWLPELIGSAKPTSMCSPDILTHHSFKKIF